MTKSSPPDISIKRIREISAQEPTEEGFIELREFLSNKWQGIQVSAAKVLGQWGGEKAVHLLQEWLINLYQTEHFWSARRAAVISLMKCVSKQDISWILTLYANLQTPLEKHELLPLVIPLPVQESRTGLIQLTKADDWQTRQAALKAYRQYGFP